MRRNKHESATEISKESQPGRPLPRTLPVSTAKAKEFWKVWASSPQSATFLETDWFELEMVTLLVDQLVQGDYKLAGEIRQRVAKFGATNEDRARLRMKFEEKEQGTSPQEVVEQLVEDTENFLKAFGD
ncbi:hypothetical protein [Streptomyces mutomycini]|uniref:phage terminase small subunit n=1 Tax=Streptomyces mutomycini TaxID=284036 RepID=UPI0033C81600